MEPFLHESGWWLGHSGAVLFCLAGILISLFSFTGSWLVVLASLLLFWLRDDGAVTGSMIIWFIVISILVELFDFFAGNVGIARRGGSRAAGWAALAGGLIGMVFGSFIPVPVLGSLIGMCAGSFAFAFAVEHRRLQQHRKAAHIARGAVWARLGVMFVKVTATLGMTAALWGAILFK